MGVIKNFRYWRYSRRFPDYRPQPITVKRLDAWMKQFSHQDEKAALVLLDSIIYLSEKKVEKLLVEQNEALVNFLRKSHVPPEKTIYVSLHDAGSSSPVMLNLLRDAAGLQRTGCHLIDGNNVLGLNKLTNRLAEGAIVYVDDFSGTGQQFCKFRNFISQHIVGNFSEFFLLPCICEEALHRLGKEGIQPYNGMTHSRTERPLHENSSILDTVTKDRLRQQSLGIHGKVGLGFSSLATMVVLYRNAPNTTPLILRGSLDQRTFVGIFPRTTDKPVPT